VEEKEGDEENEAPIAEIVKAVVKDVLEYRDVEEYAGDKGKERSDEVEAEFPVCCREKPDRGRKVL
jgi:hypothetical protein